MLSKYDIQKLQDLPIEQVASALGLTVRRHKALCPFHDDSRPSLTFSTSRNRYRCYVCDARGGTIDLVMNTQNWTFYDSCLWLANTFGVYLPDHSQSVREIREIREVRKKSLIPPPSALDLPYLEHLVANATLTPEAENFLFETRHLAPRVVKWLGLTNISRPVPMSGNPNGSWFNAPSLLIPYRDIDGRLLSVQARYLGSDQDKPRFQFPRGSQFCIYNLPLLRHLHEGDPLYVTEGCSDCWSMLSSGQKAIAIPSATALSEKDKELLLSFSSSLSLTFHMFPDNDEPGFRLFLQLQKVLPNLVHHQLPQGCKDFSDYYLLNVKC